jgi:hypothetical protein
VFPWVLIATLVVNLGTSSTESQDQLPEAGNRLGIATPSVVLVSDGEHYLGEVIFEISGDRPVVLEIDLLDVWSNDKGQRITLPPGSTPFGGQGRLLIGEHPGTYEPNGSQQRVTVPLRISNAVVEKAPLMVGVRITLRAISPQDDVKSVRVGSAAVAFAYAATEGANWDNESLRAKIDVGNLGVTPLQVEPEPGGRRTLTFVESGPVGVSFDSKNSGNLFASVAHSLIVRKWGWWVDSADPLSMVFQHEIGSVIHIPGQNRSEFVPVTARAVGSQREINLLSDWGVYEISLDTRQRSGSEKEVHLVNSSLFIVFPIRSTVAILIGAIAILWVVSRILFQRKSPKKQETRNAPSWRAL